MKAYISYPLTLQQQTIPQYNVPYSLLKHDCPTKSHCLFMDIIILSLFLLLCRGLTKMQRKHTSIMYRRIFFPLFYVQFKNTYDINIYNNTLLRRSDWQWYNSFFFLDNILIKALRIYMYITRGNMVGGQEKCILSPLSTFFWKLF